MQASLVIVCGLDAEAKIAAAPTAIRVVAGGGHAAAILSALEAARPRAVLSFGVAGGLAPETRPGDLYVGQTIHAPDGATYSCATTWSDRLADETGSKIAPFLGADAPVAEVAHKRRLHAATGAVLVDMESHIAARWAGANAAEFAAIRVVTDPADRALPHAATVGMRPDGGVDLAAILRSLARNPAQLPGLIRTGLDARAAFATLFRCRQRLGPRFARLDL